MSGSFPKGLAVAALLGAFALPPGARAQSASVEARARAFELEGERLRLDGQCARAVEHLEASLALRSTTSARRTLARCLDELDELQAARRSYQELLAQLPADSPEHTEALAALEALEKRLPTLVIRTNKDQRLRLLVDGELIDSDRALSLDPGQHTLEAGHRGRSRWVAHFTLREGQHKELVLPSEAESLQSRAPESSAPIESREPSSIVPMGLVSARSPAPEVPTTTLSFAAGLSLFRADQVDFAPSSLARFSAERVVDAAHSGIRIGLSLEVAQTTWQEEDGAPEMRGSSGNLTLLTAALTATVRHRLSDSLRLQSTLGIGMLTMLGLDGGPNPLVEPNRTKHGPSSAPLLRASMGVEVELSRALSIVVTPVEFSLSPRADGMRDQIDALSTVQAHVGAAFHF